MTGSNSDKVVVRIGLFDNECQTPYEIKIIAPSHGIKGKDGKRDLISAITGLYEGTHVDVLSVQKLETVGYEMSDRRQMMA